MRDLVRERFAFLRNGGSDSGSAIVAAIGVMIICLSLGALIISQAIVVQRDSGRDRARTVEVHSAEAAVDQIYHALQQGEFECEMEFPEPFGPDGVVVSAKLEFWLSDGTKHECANGAPFNPERARVTATARNLNKTAARTEPRRTVECVLLLNEIKNPNQGAAIFSAGGLNFNNPPAVSGTASDVWVEGNYICDSSDGNWIEGNIYAPSGTVYMSNCKVDGSIYSFGNVSLPSEDNHVTGSIFVKNGGVDVQNRSAIIEGNVVAAKGFGIFEEVVKGNIYPNVIPDPFPTAEGLPPVHYSKMSDWFDPANWDEPDEVFVTWETGETPAQAWKRTLAENANMNQIEGYDANSECPTFGDYWNTTGKIIRLPANTSGESSVPRMYDASKCDITTNGNQSVLDGGAAIFVCSIKFQGNNDGLTVYSGDGEQHRLWVIAPTDDVNGCSSGKRVESNGGFTASSEMDVFFYTPGAFDFKNVNISGNIYAGSVNFHERSVVRGAGMRVPGVDLRPGQVDIGGSWNVDVVYKRETSDRVN